MKLTTRGSISLPRVLAAVTVLGLAWLVMAVPAVAQNAYITNLDGYVSVIDTTTNTVVATIPIGSAVLSTGVAVTPDGSKVYVTNAGASNVSVIGTATNTVVATIPVGSNPFGVAVTPFGTKVYVASGGASNVSVIDTATNTVIDTIPVGDTPMAFGIFIQPKLKLFAGTPGSPNCHGTSVSALARKDGGLAAAANDLGFPSVSALQNAVTGFCGS